MVSGLACGKKSPAPAGGIDADAHPLLCSQCSHFFTIPRDELLTYPADPGGAGLKCPKCGKFAAKTAVRCPKCNQWYCAVSRGQPCPHCAKGDATPAKAPS